MSDGLTALKNVSKAIITVGTLSILIGIKESLEPAFRRSAEIILPNLAEVIRGNVGIEAGIIAGGAIGVAQGVSGLIKAKRLSEKQKTQKSNDVKNVSEKG